MHTRLVFAILVFAFLAGCSDGGKTGDGPPGGAGSDAPKNALVNQTAYVPPQCYTQTKDADGRVVNTCYTCHQAGREPNYVDDRDFQLEYTMVSDALVNPWRNLFEDRSARVAAISDAEVRGYVRAGNYRDAAGRIILARQLGKVPSDFDHDGDRIWDGYVPDCYFDFDEEGFDRDGAGAYTGWRAFAYYPFPSTHWPTNGSIGDVAIRLGGVFRRNAAGQFDLATYILNLAIVEAMIKQRDVGIELVDENLFGVDLDKDGVLGTARIVRYGWDPLRGITMSYVGQAGVAQLTGDVHLAAGLFPEETEFLQSLRYLDEADDGTVDMASRMKELRYARKYGWRTYADLMQVALDEVKDRHDFPDRFRQLIGDIERGIVNPDSGWVFQGFIEDRKGALRPQTYEETAYCAGCHGGGIGATTDSTFSFARKLESDCYRRGWYHWTQRGLAGLNEPKVEITGAGVHYEYTYYLMYTRSGDEFRGNAELRDRFFHADGTIRTDMIEALHDDVAVALLPSAERARALNKAYWTIVLDQDFIEGREVVVGPADKVLNEVEPEQPTGVEQATGVAGSAGSYRPTSAADRPDPVLDSLGTGVFGVGMGGPDGANYEVDWNGLIRKSSYASGIEGVTFTFPPRLTLPTREILALQAIPVCYDCHRVGSPIVDSDRRTTLPVDYPATVATPEETAVLTRLTFDEGRDVGARWSPDGTTIAFVSDRSGSNQVWLMDADGSNQRQLTSGPASHAWPDWSSDSRRLLYWEHDGGTHAIKTIAVDGSGETTVVSSSEYLDSPAWRPDGLHIAYSAISGGNWDVWLAMADG
ncbi:MAG: hypothetical protein MUE73_09665, partial [Planctomycetes bacterium]|nr:hypothetical protein [Planctomycetota bacterium]